MTYTLLRIYSWYTKERIALDTIARTQKQLGAILRRQRKQLGLTQATLAATLGMRQATVSELESGGRDASLSTVFDAIAALNLELVLRPRTKRSASDIEATFS